MLRYHNRPFSVVCISMHIQNSSLLFHDAGHDKCCASSLVNYTLSLGAFRQKNMANQARQSDEIIENGPTYIEQWKAQLLTESTAVKSGEVDELNQDSANGDGRCPLVYASSSAVARTEHE